MSLVLIRQNIEREKKLIEEMLVLNESLESTANLDNPTEIKKRKTINESIDTIISQLIILNGAIPELLNNLDFYKKLKDSPEIKTNIVNIKYTDPTEKDEISLAIKSKDEKKFLEQITKENNLKKIEIKIDKKEMSFTASYIRLSNRLFKNVADKLIAKGDFKSIRSDLRRITAPMIVHTYVAVMFFSTLISFILSGFFFAFLLLIKVDVLFALGLAIFVPIITFLTFYLYPSSKRSNLEKEINQELPFLTIFLAAISTSGIEPSKMFSVIIASNDYPYSQREMKKLTNYINFYGYDPVSALKISSKNCPSERLGLLFDGLATTITSGGDITEFLKKHSETLLFDYKLEREKYTRIAETFMNIYISVVIAAPMIMMMLFILMSLTGFSQSWVTPQNIGAVTIITVSLTNLAFIVFLNMKQPKF